MLRFIRSKPAIRAFGAKRANSTPGPQPEIVQLQRVKIRQKWFKPWHFVGAVAVYYACYQIYTTSVYGVLGKWLDEQFSQMSPSEQRKLQKEMDEEEGPTLFVPLPWTTRMVEPQPYKGTDPEWRNFAKFSRNQQLIADVKGTLTEAVRSAIERHPTFGAYYGKEWKVQRSWLDLYFPLRPPPTYERQVICWDDDGISVASQPIESRLALVLQRTLMPTQVTRLMLSFSLALAKQNALGVAKILGYEPAPQQGAQAQQTLERIRQYMAKSQSKTSGSTPDPSSLDPKASESKDPRSLTATTKTQTANGSTSEPPPSASPPSADSSQSSPEKKGLPGVVSPFSSPATTDDKPPSAKDIYGVREVAEHTSGAWNAMMKQWSKIMRPVTPLPPRGCVGVSGLVEISSPKASVIIEVSAWFDPKTQTIGNETLILKLRQLKPRQLTPAAR
ncbi:hypothetical protein BJ170DRAFT_684548 [Xylariales sp. AK1849]|nr:hypothetical protein BJ170DRAFT_684548 [Xylariales sp. AK1849]